MSRHIHYKHPYRLVSCVFFFLPSSFHSVSTQSNGVEYAIVIKTYLVQSFHYFWMSRFEFFVRSIMVIHWRLARKFTPLRNNNRLSRIFHMWNGKKKIIIVFKCAVARRRHYRCTSTERLRWKCVLEQHFNWCMDCVCVWLCVSMSQQSRFVEYIFRREYIFSS